MVVDTVVIFAGGDSLDEVAASSLPPGEVVIAADSGLDEAFRLGFSVDLLVGDLDSVTRESADRAARGKTRVVAHPRNKDQTDLELAMEEGASLRPSRLVIAGGGGGRSDHLFANLYLLAGNRFSAFEITWVTNRALLHVVRKEVEIRGAPGDVVSLLAHGGDASGVETEGLRWPLNDEVLAAGSTRGVSNRLADTTAKVRIRSGVLLVIVPQG